MWKASPLTAPADTAPSSLPVILIGGEEASGLADMLRQFIEQTLVDSPRKVRQARALSGRAVFRSAEDKEVCVCITFAGDHIELRDGDVEPAGAPCIAADFLTIAHLTSGQESPFRLLARRKLEARFSVAQVPFLLRMLRFMQIESASRRTTWIRWALLAAAAAAFAGGSYWFFSLASGSAPRGGAKPLASATPPVSRRSVKGDPDHVGDLLGRLV